MQTELPIENVPSDEQFEQSLLELLSNTRLQIYTIHGQMLDEWYENKEAGPIIITQFAKVLADDFEEELENRYPKTTIFSLLLNEDSPENASYFVVISHKNFYSLAMFGQELTPEQFANYLEIAKADDDER